jgi:hypothetical protein
MTTMSERDLAQWLPRLLRENPELRYQIVGILQESFAGRSEFMAILDELRRLREDFNRKVEEDSKRFASIEDELRRLREDFNRKVEEDSKRFASIETQLLGLRKEVGGLSESVGSWGESFGVWHVEESLRRRGVTGELRRDISVQGKQVDAILSDGVVYLIEIKSVVRKRDMHKAERTRRLLQEQLGSEKTVKALVAGSRVDKSAVEAARSLGVEVVFV